MILYDEQIPHIKDTLSSFDDVRSFVGRSLTNKQIIESGADALFVRSTTRVNTALLDDTSVRFVASATAGVDHIEVADLERAGITFYYAAGSNAGAVVEYVMASVQDLCEAKPPTIGVIGYGHVGSRLAEVASKLGWTVLVSDPPLEDRGALTLPQGVRVGSLKEIVTAVDVVSLHVPLTMQGAYATYRLLNAEMLALMRTGMLLINTSRGGVIDEAVLLGLLKSNDARIGVVLDVYENEPTPSVELIRRALRSTPHVAGYTRNAKENGAWMVMSEWAKWKGVKIPAQPMHTSESLTVRDFARDSDVFRSAWLEAPTAETFDTARKEYALCDEKLELL